MNLLSIQDNLKGVSDQDLARMMQSPDSTAPSYLVLSEIRRRKDMRTKAGDAPASTVAEDLVEIPQTYTDGEGIRSLRVPGYEAEQDQGADTGAGIEAMRAGGIVRMADGGAVYGSIPFTENEYERMTVPRSLMSIPGAGGAVPMFRPSSQLSSTAAPSDRLISAARQELDQLFLRNPSMRGNSAIIEQTAMNYGVPVSALRGPVSGVTPSASIESNEPRASMAAFTQDAPRRLSVDQFIAPQTASEASPAVANQPAQIDVGRPASEPPASIQSVSAQQFGPSAPVQSAADIRSAGSRTQSSAGGSGAAPASAVSGTAGINMQDIMRRNMELIPGIPEELMNRLREGRTNEPERRRQAQSNALVEAGLRIAASNNPRLAGAIGEGALPAVQGYTQQLGQIRQDQRAELQQEMAAAQADIQRRYMAGQLSAAEYRSAMEMTGRRDIAEMQIAAQRAQSGASSAAADARQARSDARADALNRTNLERETLRQTALTERANQEARDRLTMSAAQEAARAVRDPMVLLQTRSTIDAERRRANPGGTFTPSTDEDVERFLTQRILRTYENTRQSMGQQGGRGGSASQNDPLGLR